MIPNDAVPTSSTDSLQFDTAVAAPSAGAAVASEVSTTPTCAECARSIGDRYYAAGSTVICPECRGRIDAVLAAPVGASGYLRAVVFGIGASLAGAAVWFAVYKFLNLEIGIIAIAVGWMVGRVMQVGSGGRGSRRLQLAAAALTYLAVALSYSAIALSHLDASRITLAKLAGAMPVLVALPVTVSLGSLPMGSISLLIIFIGLRQAWQMTRRVEIAFEGPFRVGGASAPGEGHAGG